MRLHKKTRIVYKTINLINGKIYIGKDSYNNPKYLGSGSNLKSDIQKYGEENFKKEILEFCTSDAELNNCEKYWIKKLNAQDSTIGYNIAFGTEGGDRISKHPRNKQIRKHISKVVRKRYKDPIFYKRWYNAQNKRLNDPKYHETLSKAHKESYRKNPSRSLKTRHVGKDHFNWKGYIYVYTLKNKFLYVFETVGAANKALKLEISRLFRNNRIRKIQYKQYKFIRSKFDLLK